MLYKMKIIDQYQEKIKVTVQCLPENMQHFAFNTIKILSDILGEVTLATFNDNCEATWITRREGSNSTLKSVTFSKDDSFWIVNNDGVCEMGTLTEETVSEILL
jgi:hypothetical protein